jgi:hypothetical protein
MHKKLIPIAEHLICTVEEQMEDLEGACTQELGEVIDMIKDLSKAIYYDVVTEAMLDTEEISTASIEETPKNGYSEYYKYIKAKHINSDSAILMKNLEDFISKFSTDMLEIITNASPEEKQYLHKKMTSLTNKIV